jgi:hypothetical protein
MITKKEAISSLLVGAAVIIVTPMLGAIVPAIFEIPVVKISLGALLSAGVVAYAASMLTAKYVNI